jgi:hypothetical protein
MTNRKTPTSTFSISDLQQTNRGILVDNRWAFVFSTDIQDWITQRARKQQFESRKRISNGKRKEG